MVRHVTVILALMWLGLLLVPEPFTDIVALAGIGALLLVLIRDRWFQRRARGYVYLIRDPATGETKIGLTRRQPTARLAELTKGPRELELLHVITTPYPRELERALHRRYAHKRGRGEWFALSPSDLRALKRLDGRTVRHGQWEA